MIREQFIQELIGRGYKSEGVLSGKLRGGYMDAPKGSAFSVTYVYLFYGENSVTLKHLHIAITFTEYDCFEKALEFIDENNHDLKSLVRKAVRNATIS